MPIPLIANGIMLLPLIKKIEPYAKKFLVGPVEIVEVFLLGKHWWVVGPPGSGKSSMHRYLSGRPFLLSEYLKTNRIAEAPAGVKVISSPDSQSFVLSIFKKKGLDYGGESPRAWEQDISKSQRFVFIFALHSTDLHDHTSSFSALRRTETGLRLAPESKTFDTVEDSLRKAISCLIKHFPIEDEPNSPLKKKHRKLWMLCNKFDLVFPQGRVSTEPGSLTFWREATDRLDEIVKEAELTKKTGFTIIHGYTTFHPDYRRFTEQSIAPILKKIEG